MMSSWPFSASDFAEMLPECEPPRTTLGPPIITFMPCRRDSSAASWVVGNSATTMPSAAASATCSAVASSWLASGRPLARRSEEHTSELQSLMRISYAVFCLKKQNTTHNIRHIHMYTQEQQISAPTQVI